MALPVTLRGSSASSSALLQFATIGSVDDGKSTLIGRLLHDSRAIADDQLAALEQASRRRGRDGVDLSLLTDGLRAEREQGITIDVAYRYFATPRRTFVIADTPGHVQYTRNTVTGCTTADLAVVLVDARRGVSEQTRRHVVIAALLRVPHLVVAVNKMDLVGWDESVFGSIRAEVVTLAAQLGIPDAAAIPISALRGDNVVARSDAMPWYEGPALLGHLESLELGAGHDLSRVRLPVQMVLRDPADPDYRAYAGRIESGILRPGDPVVALPSGISTNVRSIDTFGGPLAEAFPPLSIAVRLADAVDLGRGGLIAGAADAPRARHELTATVCWLGDEPLREGRRYWLHHTTRAVRAIVVSIDHRLDVATLERDDAAGELRSNDIGRARLRLAGPVFSDTFATSRATGSAILIDEATNATVAAVLVEGER
ncbi:MAG: GTP-binding protein [Chloroflexi bacterium]|nr:GTP-binding protein [Chloroflexota bacterium]